MDPCCGSGHFLVEAFGMLWQMRAAGLHLAPRRAGPRRLDLAGSALFGGSIVSLLLALSMLGDDLAFAQTVPFWVLVVASVVVKCREP